MKYEDIQTFIEAADTGSFIKAAQNLYISQGTVSTRITQLEAELQICLFERHRGMRKLTLTEEGKQFLSIARQWMSLNDEAMNIHLKNRREKLTVAATDMINTETFMPLYEKMVSKHQEILFTLRTNHSTEIHRMIEQNEADLGFCLNLHPSSDIISTPVYEESYVLVCHRSHPFLLSGNYGDLNSSSEVHMHYSDVMEHWYRRVFTSSQNPLLVTGTVSMVPSFMTSADRWAVLPESAARLFVKTHNEFVIHPFTDHIPPSRITYLLRPKHPNAGNGQAVNLFLSLLKEYLETRTDLHILY